MATERDDLGRPWAEIRDFVEGALAEPVTQGAVRVVTVPAPGAPLTRFLEAMPREMSFLWNNPPSGISCAGGGVTHRIDVQGEGRLEQLRAQAQELWERTRRFVHPGAPDVAPRLCGGLAFSPANSRRRPWVEFGDGAFSLARWTYGQVGSRHFLSLALGANGGNFSDLRDEILKELEGLIDHLSAGREVPADSAARKPIPAENLLQLPRDLWERHIRSICDAIRGGSFLKIVAARRCDVTLPEPLSDFEVINRLFAETKCTQFAFRRAETSFVGASPELLFYKAGIDLRTQALAGTIRSTGHELHAVSGQSARLLGSPKDRSEQDFVVRAIHDCLAPLCSEVTVADEPEVVHLPNILHINTPFEAKLLPETHATQILEVLHPTPAVGGVPGLAAREWIVANEVEERGWYTGPMGWLDSDGDAEFAVAIRCGVLAETHAHLFTGAGVVLDSDHTAEYEETALKQLPMLRALGVELH